MPRIIRFKKPKVSRREFRRNYTEYIKSEEWERKREEAFMFHGRSCKKCGKTRSLHVHHMTYVRLKNELMQDLCILCTLCHGEYHKINKTVSISSTEAFLTLTGPVDPKSKTKRKKTRYERICEFDKINIALSTRRRSREMNHKIRAEWELIKHQHDNKPLRHTGLLSMKDVLKRQDEMEKSGKL